MILVTKQFEFYEDFKQFILKNESSIDHSDLLKHEYDHCYVARALGYNVVYQVDINKRRDDSISYLGYSIRFLGKLPNNRDTITISLAPESPGLRDLVVAEEARWQLNPR